MSPVFHGTLPATAAGKGRAIVEPAGRVIPEDLMGEVWPAAEPGAGPADRGSASIDVDGPVEIRSFRTIVVSYTVGRFGLDDTGGIKIVQRFANDGGRWQTDDAAAMNYVTAKASNGCRLLLAVEPGGHQRPWNRSLRIVVTRGSMACGDRIEVVFGDRRGGSPGLRLQTFAERAHEFRVLVDACATGHFLPVPGRPCVTVVPGPPRSWIAVLPTWRRPGSRFALCVRADDLWGNPAFPAPRRLRFVSGDGIEGLPDSVAWPEGQGFLRLDGLVCAGEGQVAVDVLSGEGELLARSNPLIVRNGPLEAFWGDLHGQSGETVGIDPLEDYFSFARDLAFLDVCSHQGNDFQITNRFWQRINEVTAAANVDGRFIAIPGYEWSGNTSMGGDHNVFFREEGRAIRRSSHALLADRGDLDSDAATSGDLFRALAGEDCVLFAHIGGRPADIAEADGLSLRTAVEIHSNWGTFEWLMAESFALGYRHGLVCNSDVHKGRPGASHPGAAEFGAYGGLTCFLAGSLTRDGIFEALRARHHYGTTGSRIHMDVRAEFANPARLFAGDPRLGPAASRMVREAMMGDIVETADRRVALHLDIASPSPVVRVDVLNGTDVAASLPGFAGGDADTRLRVLFHGAEYRGRGRQTRWRGSLKVMGAAIRRFHAVCAWNHERPMGPRGDGEVVFDVLTTGNFTGFDIWLDAWRGSVELRTGHVAGVIELASIGDEPHLLEAGGLERAVSLTRLPEVLDETRMTETADVPLNDGGDNPLWARVTTEDGHRAWSSPLYLFRLA